MSSAVARPMRSSSKTLTSSKVSYFLRLVSVERPGAGRCRVGVGGLVAIDPGAIRSRRCSRLDGGTGRCRAPPPRGRRRRRCRACRSAMPSLESTSTFRHSDCISLMSTLKDSGMPGLRDVLALDDGLVDLDAAEDVVGLDRQQLLERVGGAVGLERPDLHLAEPLATELRLTAERLLGDHRVRAGRAGVDLVVDQVVQLQDVHVADRDRLRERLAGAAVEQLRLAAWRRPGGRRRGWAGSTREQTGDLLLRHAVEDRRRDLGARLAVHGVGRDLREPLRLPSASRRPPSPAWRPSPRWVSSTWPTFIRPGTPSGLSTMSTGGAVREERHVLDGQDLGDDALVAVTAGELVAVGDLALLRRCRPGPAG